MHIYSLITLAWCSYSCCWVLLVGHYLFRCTVHLLVYYLNYKMHGARINMQFGVFSAASKQAPKRTLAPFTSMQRRRWEIVEPYFHSKMCSSREISNPNFSCLLNGKYRHHYSMVFRRRPKNLSVKQRIYYQSSEPQVSSTLWQQPRLWSVWEHLNTRFHLLPTNYI